MCHLTIIQLQRPHVTIAAKKLEEERTKYQNEWAGTIPSQSRTVKNVVVVLIEFVVSMSFYWFIYALTKNHFMLFKRTQTVQNRIAVQSLWFPNSIFDAIQIDSWYDFMRYDNYNAPQIEITS